MGVVICLLIVWYLLFGFDWRNSVAVMDAFML